MNAPLSSPPRPTNNNVAATSFETKRLPRESQFVYKHGHRHHAYDPEKAPYPASYDRYVLEQESLNHAMVTHCQQSVSFVEFKDGLPTRSLDLGCGQGIWVIDAAKAWPDCHFVGFDLVNVQLPLSLLEPSVAKRIQWVYGNFLTTKLPFDEDEFDHVRIQFISRGVPENKWGVLFEEVNRVLRSGGVVEVTECDIIFPQLPRWFTAPLRVRTRRAASVHLPDGTQRTIEPFNSSTSHPPPAHDHALLESLYLSVFESRFINLRPTAVLPVYFTTYFRQVTLGPVVTFPMPPLPPIQPIPQEISNNNSLKIVSDASDPLALSMYIAQPQPKTRPASLSISSSISESTTHSAARSSAEDPSLFSSFVRDHSNSFSSVLEKPVVPIPPTPPNETIGPLQRFVLLEPPVGSDEEQTLPSVLAQIQKLSERSLAMHLHRAYNDVLSCQEAMWEELKDRLRNRKDQLKQYGWDDDEELEELQNRKKFELLIERFRGDMQARVALGASLTAMGWPQPQREPLTKAEIIEEERVRKAMLEARQYATAEDFQVPCRTARGMVGYKAC